MKKINQTIMVVGAHPDDYEFGCGGILLKANTEGFNIIPVILSSGESGSSGTPEIRNVESQKAAKMLGADLIKLPLNGDARLMDDTHNRVQLARLIRKHKPAWVFAPSSHPNQHPDHVAASFLCRNSLRIARFGGFSELKNLDPHRDCKIAFYDISSRSAKNNEHSIIIDISGFEEQWIKLMNCHDSQTSNKQYVDLQITRAKASGLENGCQLAQTIMLETPPLLNSMEQLLTFKEGATFA